MTKEQIVLKVIEKFDEKFIVLNSGQILERKALEFDDNFIVEVKRPKETIIELKQFFQLEISKSLDEFVLSVLPEERPKEFSSLTGKWFSASEGDDGWNDCRNEILKRARIEGNKKEEGIITGFMQAEQIIKCGNCHPEKYENCKQITEKYPSIICDCVCHKRSQLNKDE